MVSMQALLNYLAAYGGQIISSNDLQPEWIEQARASDRMHVDRFGLGYVWEPIFKNGFPETDKEVAQFEQWYPLPVELPQHLKDISFLFKNS